MGMTESAVTSGTNSSILGTERDMELYISAGNTNYVATAGVFSQEFACSTPSYTTGYSLLQYDGNDESMKLNPKGLGGIDLTADGSNAFSTNIGSDVATNVTFIVYSGYAHANCTYQL